MGQLLSEPVTTKNTSSLENSQFKVGSSAMQGWRVGIHLPILRTHAQTGGWERSWCVGMYLGGFVRFHVCSVRVLLA